jgi:hypothetical protein
VPEPLKALLRQTSVEDALAWFAAFAPRVRAAPCLGAAVEQYLAAHPDWRPATGRSLGYALRHFAAEFGHLRPWELTAEVLRAYLGRWPHGPTRHRVRGDLEALCTWFVRQEWLPVNPVVRAGTMSRPRGRRGCLYTPEEARRVLRQAQDTELLGYWVLALFAGLRTTEIERLGQADLAWSCIDLKARRLELPAWCSKTRVARDVPLLPVAVAWLQRFAGRPVVPANLYYQLARARRDWPELRGRNRARRSYISYRLVLPGASYSAVAAAAGNSVSIIRNYYRCLVRRADARRYFSLFPP